MKLTWDEIVDATKGRMVCGRPEGEFSGVSTDTRSIKAGDLFVALKGENFDGHAFVGKALEKGACGAVVGTGHEVPLQNIKAGFVIQVDDPLYALGEIARLWRAKTPAFVIGITGSNGKTTSKEMSASILSRRYSVLKTEGNLNNLIGLPHMVLRLNEGHEAAVFEMGMNAFGEIGRLSSIAVPDVALITNIGAAHLEGVGNMEGVARAKKEILTGLKREGTFVVNIDDPYIRKMAPDWPGRIITFAVDSPQADVKVSLVDTACCYGEGMTLSMLIRNEPLVVKIKGLGRHNVYNAAASAAVAVALSFGTREIKEGLEEWKPFKGRFELQRLESGVNLIDDTYNANPDSTKMALKGLADVRGVGRGIAVLGDMLELGEYAESGHYEVGKRVAKTGVDYLFVMGPLSTTHTACGAREGGMAEDRIVIVKDHAEAVERLDMLVTGGDWVLVKGSRGMVMERVVEGLGALLTKRR